MQRYLEGKASEQERIKIEAWLEVMKTQNNTNLELSKADEEKLFQKITSATTNVKDVVSFKPTQVNKNTSWALQMAAAVAILVSLSYILWDYTNPKNNALEVSSQNGVEKIILQDGTIVWLQQGSKLSYFEKKQEGTRHTNFQGEALFEVAKDAAHPFIITCGNTNLRVLGTSFSLKSVNDSLQLAVLTGKVSVSSGPSGETVEVSANEKAIVVKNEVKKLQLGRTEVSTLTVNTEYNMQFDNTSLAEVAERISKKFNVEVNISNEKARACRITADFTDLSLQSTLKLITEVLDVNYTQNDNKTTITGNGCE